jgi:hypothetical protein
MPELARGKIRNGSNVENGLQGRGEGGARGTVGPASGFGYNKRQLDLDLDPDPPGRAEVDWNGSAI